MSTNDKKNRNEEMFDHMIEYGTSEWAEDISPDDIPEEELSDELNKKMDNMFASARKKANRKRRFITARRIAAVFVVLLTMASITVMSVEAFRVPVLNFIFEKSNTKNKFNISVNDSPTNNDDIFVFDYIPNDYKFIEKTIFGKQNRFVYEYRNNNGSTIYINIQTQINYDYYLDIVEGSYSKIFYNNNTYYYIKNTNSELFGYKDKCLINIKANITKHEFLLIADNIKLKKSSRRE